MGKAKWIIPILAVILTVTFVISGTVAWLIADTDPVVNVFTYGDINIELSESGMEQVTPEDGSEPYYEKEFKMLPGRTMTKDPKVTVKAGSEDCWLFVEMVKSEQFDSFMEYKMADDWELVDGTTNVYYQTVTMNETEDQVFAVIKDDEVSVKGSVTKEMLNSLDANPDSPNYPKLTITAYAVQRDGEIEAIDTAAEAWALAKPAEENS